MTLRHPNLNKHTLFVFMLTMSLLAAAAKAKDGDENRPIDVNADRSEYDDKAGIQRLSGNVEIVQGSLKITAEEIAIHLKDRRLARIEGSGNPIRFEQLNNADEPIVGEATTIDYNAIDGTLILTGSARLKQPRQELNSNRIVFNSRAQTVQADGGDKGRVTLRIQPPQAGQ